MNILSIIPARSGSKGVKNKNLEQLGGKPLIEYAIRAAQKTPSVNRLIVSTESEHIADIAGAIGAEIPFIRPQELARDNSPLLSVSQHALGYFREKGVTFDAILSLQPTNPFVRAETIEAAIGIFKASRCDSVTTVSEITSGHPYIAKKLLPDNKIDDFSPAPPDELISPRQKRKKAFFLTGSMYLRRTELLEAEDQGGHCLGADARAVVVSNTEAVDINDPMDLAFAEFLIQSGHVKI